MEMKSDMEYVSKRHMERLTASYNYCVKNSTHYEDLDKKKISQGKKITEARIEANKMSDSI